MIPDLMVWMGQAQLDLDTLVLWGRYGHHMRQLGHCCVRLRAGFSPVVRIGMQMCASVLGVAIARQWLMLPWSTFGSPVCFNLQRQNLWLPPVCDYVCWL